MPSKNFAGMQRDGEELRVSALMGDDKGYLRRF